MAGESERLFLPPDYFRELKTKEIFVDAGEERPLEIDLGAGDGTFAVEMARHFPERNFLAVERLLGRARKVARKAERAGLANLKVLRLESAYSVEWLLPAGAVSRVHLLFPDPWPKRKHHPRRLARSEEFHRGLRRVLRDEDGEFSFKTDHAGYFEDATKAFAACPFFEARDWDADAYYPETDFERQWRAEGREVYSARWVKVTA